MLSLSDQMVSPGSRLFIAASGHSSLFSPVPSPEMQGTAICVLWCPLPCVTGCGLVVCSTVFNVLVIALLLVYRHAMPRSTNVRLVFKDME